MAQQQTIRDFGRARAKALKDRKDKTLAPRQRRGLPRFKSKHDDFIDTISMLASLYPWKPSEEAPLRSADNGMWEADDEDDTHDRLSSYIV